MVLNGKPWLNGTLLVSLACCCVVGAPSSILAPSSKARSPWKGGEITCASEDHLRIEKVDHLRIDGNNGKV